MKISTSYISKINKIKELGMVPVSVTRFLPETLKVENIPELSPETIILFRYKRERDVSKCTNSFKLQFSKLNKEEIIKQLEYISQKNDNADIVLVCYEKKGDFCHRHILAEWLGSDYNIEELSFE